MSKARYPNTADLPERKENDAYPTDIRLATAALLTAFEPSDYNSPIIVLDPGAGTGIWGKAAKGLFDCMLYGVDIDRTLEKPAEYDDWIVCDYLRWIPADTYWHPDPDHNRFDLICGNPPFGGGAGKTPLWEKFLTHSWSLLKPGGTIIFLLKVEVSTGIARCKGLWQKYPPVLCLPCCPRPSYIPGSRSTNMNDVAIWVWKKEDWFTERSAGTPGEWPTRPFDWIRVTNAWMKENN